MDTRDIELVSVSMSFGVGIADATDTEPEMVVPTALLTVVVMGNDVPELQDSPVEMLGIIMEQIATKHAEGLINPVKVFDGREQADGSPE